MKIEQSPFISNFIDKMQHNYTCMMKDNIQGDMQMYSIQSFCGKLESYGFVREDKPSDYVFYQYILIESPFQYIIKFRDCMRMEIRMYYRSASGELYCSEYNNNFERILRYFKLIEEIFHMLTMNMAEFAFKTEHEEDLYLLSNRKLSIK